MGCPLAWWKEVSAWRGEGGLWAPRTWLWKENDFNSPSAPSEGVLFVLGGTPWLDGAARTNPERFKVVYFSHKVYHCVKGWASVLPTESRDGSSQHFLMFHQTARLKMLLIASFQHLLNKFLSNY